MVQATGFVTEGKKQFQLGNYELAVAHFESALNHGESCMEAHMGMGFSFHALGRSHQAIDSFNKSIAIDPNFAETHFGLGLALMAADDPYRAIREFKATLKLNPHHPLCLKMLQKALQLHTKDLLTEKNVLWAEQCIKDQLEIDEHCLDALAQLIELKFQMAEYGEARRHFLYLRETRPDHPALFELAEMIGIDQEKRSGRHF